MHAAGVPFFFKQWGEWRIAAPTRPIDEHNPYGLPLKFGDGESFDVFTDHEDILLSRAEAAKTPEHIWRDHFGDGHGHLSKGRGKDRTGRLLDGREHNDLPWTVSK